MDTTHLWPARTDIGRKPRLYNLLTFHSKAECRTPDGVLDVRKFAEAVGKSHECVYKWLRADYFLPKNIVLILAASNSRLTRKKLLPYTTKNK